MEEIPGWKWEKDLFQQWFNNYELLKKENALPKWGYITECGVKLCDWCNMQRQLKKKKKLSQEKIKLLEEIPYWLWEFPSWNDKWYGKYELLKKEKQIPIVSYVTHSGVKLGTWVVTQRQEQKNNKLSQEKIKLLEEIPGWKWIVKNKKDMSKPEIKQKKTDKEIKKERQQRVQSELSQLHKEYKTKNSQNLNTYFKENPEKWKDYHKISKVNEESFPDEEIPRNKMIKYLENLPR